MNWPQKVTIAFLLVIAAAASGDVPATQPATDPLDLLASKILYYPRKYDTADIDAFVRDGGIQLDYKTPQGKQAAWLITPANDAKVERLWVVCAGNATLALDMSPFCHKLGLASDAFVLVDYPGYGLCEGEPSPGSVRENVKASVLAAAARTGIDVEKKPGSVCVFGHSLGCSASLMAVEEFHLKSAVLCSPFTSTHEMAELKVGLAKNAPFKHQFDNRPGLKELQTNKGHAWIIHGSADEIIPVQMSKTLAAEFPDVVKLQVIQDARHNDILRLASKQILQAMTDARK